MAADPAGTPIAFGIDLLAGEAALDQRVTLGADIAGFAEDIGVALSRRPSRYDRNVSLDDHQRPEGFTQTLRV